MNTVRLTQLNTETKLKAEINGENVSEFSDLSTILQAPFLNIAERIVAQLDAEIYDDYEIIFNGCFFQYQVLISYAERSPYCKNVVFEKMSSLYSDAKVEEILSSICNNHNLTVKTKGDYIPIYFEISLDISGDIVKEASSVEAEICVYDNPEQITYSENKTVLLLGSKAEFITISGKKVLQLPQNLLTDFFNFYKFYKYHISFVSDCKNALSFVKLNTKEEKQINSLYNNLTDYYITEIPHTIDDTGCISFEFESFPENKYDIYCDNHSILNVAENKIEPLSSGRANVFVKDENGEIVYSQEIEVIGHQYATELRIVPRFSELKINERSKLDVVVLPQSAEDAKEISYLSSDENILTIDTEGNALALNPGTVTITVSGKKVKSSLDVTIMPNLERIYFSDNTISLKIGQTKVVECNTVPADASTNGFVWQFDNNSIASINYSTDGKKCKITAATQKEGKGNLRCYDPKTGFSAVCPVDVYARVRLNLIQKILYVLSAIGFFCVPVLLIPIVADIVLFLNTKEEQKKKAYIFNIVLSVALGIAGLIMFS